MNAPLTYEQANCYAMMLVAFALFMASLHLLRRVQIERRRLRIEIAYVRRAKKSQEELKAHADVAWRRVHESVDESDQRLAARHQAFWKSFADAYGKATGIVFPSPPPDLFTAKKGPPTGAS